MSMIRLEYVEVVYGRSLRALALERLEIERGERVAIIGPSGSGKSTLLRCIKGYVRPLHGKVEVMGVNLTTAPRRARRSVNRRVGLIYQQFNLARKLTVLQNVLCGRLGITPAWRSLVGWFTAADRRAAWASICEVGLQRKVHQRVDSLSGGEQQRVAIARATAQEPAIILADEPVSSLDPAWAEDVLELLNEVQARHGATLVMSLHQPALARKFAQRTVAVREGRVVFDGAPAALTEAHLKELYRGDDSVTLDDAAGRPAPGLARGA